MSENGNTAAAPNLFSYVTLINTYVRTGNAYGTQKAEDTLLELYEKFKGGRTDLKPNSQIISAVIDCWQKSGLREAGEKAESLLDWALGRYEEDQDQGMAPNEYAFASTISAWGRSRKFDKALRAREVLNRMIDLYESGRLHARPNTHCFTAVINSCAYCENDEVEKNAALRIAISTYKDLCASEYGPPNEVTFSSLLTALRNLLPVSKERTSAALNVFRSAAKEGLVDNIVVKRLQSLVPKDNLRELFPSDIMSIDGDLRVPTEWKRNVPSSAKR